MTSDLRKTRHAVAAVTAATLAAWVFHSLCWEPLLDGDSALYPVMSAEILKGHHYIYTAGQSHGGTLLTYLRALLFAVFGLSHFAASFVNGLAVAAAVALWAAAAGRLGGWVAAAVTGATAALGSGVFIQYSHTDYFAAAIVCGGLMLNVAIALAESNRRISALKSLALGLLLGFSLYLCRYTALYALAAVAFYLARSPETVRASLLPSPKELLRARGSFGLLSRLAAAAVAINVVLFVAAFFTSDRFLGVDAEVTLKLIVKLSAALWLLHRWRLLAAAPARWALFALGTALGLIPHFVFGHLHPEAVDRTTGLVRWPDLAQVLPELGFNLGSNFSRADPLTFGLAGVLAAAVLLAIALATGERARKRVLVVALLAGLLPTVGSWMLIHTYMYFKVQYFYPAVLPLCLALGLAAACVRPRGLAALLVLPMLAAGANDLRWLARQPAKMPASGVLEQMKKWKVEVGSGEYDATYNLMWAYKNEVTLDPLKMSRFPLFQEQLLAAKRFAYVYRPGDARPDSHGLSGLKILEHVELNNGFSADLLERK